MAAPFGIGRTALGRQRGRIVRPGPAVKEGSADPAPIETSLIATIIIDDRIGGG
jgi:hypothetical protein